MQNMSATTIAATGNIATITSITVKDPAAAPTPIDHSKDILISNKATYSELLAVLNKRPEMADSIKTEQEEKRREAEEKRLRMALGEDYESFVIDSEQDTASPQNIVPKKTRRRPGAIQLRTNFPRVAMIKIGKDGLCEVFSNGYAVYDNGNRRTVLWVFDCGTVTYYFNGLRDSQKDYLKQKDTIGEDVLGALPWYHAIMIAGENSIERNMIHPKSSGSSSDCYDEEYEEVCKDMVSSDETPEEKTMRIEREKARRDALTDKQREVYDLYYIQGYNQLEIADLLGIKQQSVMDRLNGIMNKVKTFEENFL